MGRHGMPTTDSPAVAARGIVATIREKGRDIRDTLQEAGCTAKNMAQTARDTAADYVEKGRHTATELSESLETQVRTRPLLSILCAAGIGFLAGILLKRRRS
ncbi:MAG TPA: hypothetical protein VG056_12610 [Pirellulales bacterium]|nr:hypothetical protein [Pirellulales bacterium]